MTNGLSHPYHLDGSTFIIRDVRSILSFSFHFFDKNHVRVPPDGMPRPAVSHLGLFNLPISHKKDVRLIWVNTHVQ